MGVIKSPWPVVHIHRYIDDTQTDPDSGTSPLIEDPPVVRKLVSITQSDSTQVMDAGFEDRMESTLRLTTLEPDKYTSDDHVMIGAQYDADGNWIAGSGTAYFVDGTPTDNRVGPWPRLLKQFGGVVRVRRVT